MKIFSVTAAPDVMMAKFHKNTAYFLPSLQSRPVCVLEARLEVQNTLESKYSETTVYLAHAVVGSFVIKIVAWVIFGRRYFSLVAHATISPPR